MPRVYKRKVDGRPYRNYTQLYLDKAVNAVKSGQMSLRQASSRFGIHRNTLWRKANGLSTNHYGGKAVFDQQEETSFMNHISTLSECGFPVSINDLRYIAKQHLDRTQRIVSTFKDNLPGRDWASSFMQRYESTEPTLKSSKATTNDELVHLFFERLERVAEGVPASNIWSYDETGLADDLSDKKVVSKRGMKYPDHKYNALRAGFSVMLLGNAEGCLAPLYVNYKAEKMKPSWTEGGPEGTRYNRTSSGWCDYHTFEDWFLSVCLPLLKEQSGPKILMGDITSSVISLEVMNLCLENDIKLLAFPKKSSHLLQPLNLAFFCAMKCYWQNILESYYSKRRVTVIPKDKFPSLLHKMMTDMMTIADTKQRIVDGFGRAGICPLDRSRVMKKMPSSKQQKSLEEPLLSETEASEEEPSEDASKPSTSTRRSLRKKKRKVEKSVTTPQSSTEALSECEIIYENNDHQWSDDESSVTDERTGTEFLVNGEPYDSTSMPTCLNGSQSDSEPISVYEIQSTHKVGNKKYILVKLVGSYNS